MTTKWTVTDYDIADINHIEITLNLYLVLDIKHVLKA